MTRTIQIPFGKGFQTLHVPEERLRAVISPKHGEEAPGDASAIVQAVTNWQDSKLLAKLSENLGPAMVGINADEIETIMEERGK